jgi:serine O-acetyltransferase
LETDNQVITNEKSKSRISRLWESIVNESIVLAEQEKFMRDWIERYILSFDCIEDSALEIVSERLSPKHYIRELLISTGKEMSVEGLMLSDYIEADLFAIRERDPACVSNLGAFIYYKGFHAIILYRICRWLWNVNRKMSALFLTRLGSDAFAVDIHPGARIGRGIFLDHATSIVIGETSVIGNNVSILHEVTLGGNGKCKGDRHPKVGDNVLIGAGAKVIGNISIGQGAKIGAGSVVIRDVPASTTVVGVPAKIVAGVPDKYPSRNMDHSCGLEQVN